MARRAGAPLMPGLFSTLANAGRAAERDVANDRFFGPSETALSGRVTSETVVQASAVLPCVGIIAETIGSTTLEFQPVDGDETSERFPFEEVFANQPNPLMTGAEVWSTFAFNAVLRGRAYAEPVVISADEVELWPLMPTRYQEHHGERTFGLDYFYEDGRTRHFRAGELLTGTGLTPDGVHAVVPWKTARTAIELANILESFGTVFFRNGARPSGVLSTDQALTPEAIDRLKAEFNGNFAGVLNAGKVPVLEQSLTYQPIVSSNKDGQYLEIRRNQIRELARNWRIPPVLIGETDEWDEAAAQGFVRYTLRPWCHRLEQAIRRDLMTPAQRKLFKPRFNLDALLRGDSATQHRNAVLARTSSTHSINELRTGWFGLPKINEDWANDPRAPLNSNRAADTMTGGTTAPQDRSDV
jgi:HK97 family phage portal protein